jgi:type IV secretion system protein VirD4
MSNIDVKKLVIKILPFVIFFYLGDKAGQAFRLAAGADISARILNISAGFSAAFANPLPSLHPQDMLIGAVGAGIIALLLQQKKANAKKYRRGVEYGSARWGNAKTIKPYVDPKPENNMILTATEVVICRGLINRSQKNVGSTAFWG